MFNREALFTSLKIILLVFVVLLGGILLYNYVNKGDEVLHWGGTAGVMEWLEEEFGFQQSDTETTEEAESTEDVLADEDVFADFDNMDSEQQEESVSATTNDVVTDIEIPEAGGLSYEIYRALSPEKQEEYFEKFESEEEFFAWYRTAKAEYDEAHQGVSVEGDSIDIGDYMD